METLASLASRELWGHQEPWDQLEDLAALGLMGDLAGRD